MSPGRVLLAALVLLGLFVGAVGTGYLVGQRALRRGSVAATAPPATAQQPRPVSLPGPARVTAAVPSRPPDAAPRFHVQAGAFADRQGAAALARRLASLGYAVTLVDGPSYRVWVGATSTGRPRSASRSVCAGRGSRSA